MRSYVALALAAIMATGAAHAQKADVKDTWNLELIYPTVAGWNADKARVESQIADFAKCAGHLGDSAVRLRECLDLRSDIDKRMARLFTYATEKFSDDTGSPAN